MQSTARQFEAQVQQLEAAAGQELFNEAELISTLQDNLIAAQAEIADNPFLEDGGWLSGEEKAGLTAAVNQRYVNLLASLTSRLEAIGTNADIAQCQFWLDEINRDAQRFTAQLQTTLFSGLDAAADGGKIWNSEFADLVDSLPSVEPIALGAKNEAGAQFITVEAGNIPAVLEAGETEHRRIYQTRVEGVDCFFQLSGPDTLLFFFPQQQGPPLSVKTQEADSVVKLGETIKVHLSQTENRFETEIDSSLSAALTTPASPLPALPATMWENVAANAEDENLALDAGYNMGVRGALTAKAQMMVCELIRAANLGPEPVLDAGWGPQSKSCTQALFAHHNLPYTGNFTADLKTLRTLYQQETGQQASLFLTSTDINHPNYKFENKGVFRGPKAAQVQSVFAQYGLGSDSLPHVEAVLNVSLSKRIKTQIPTIVATLEELQVPAAIQHRIVATTILENGISRPDILGVDLVGRGDKKAALQLATAIAPQTTTLATGRLSITSNGITQINYRTAQAMLGEYLGVTMSRPQLVEMLGDNDRLAVLMSVLVYYQNQQQIANIKSQFINSIEPDTPPRGSTPVLMVNKNEKNQPV